MIYINKCVCVCVCVRVCVRNTILYSYLRLLEEPRLVALLDAVVGEDVKCVEIGARTVPGSDGSSGSDRSCRLHVYLLIV